jgi:3-hydroxyisobutyrate dehydrogenase
VYAEKSGLDLQKTIEVVSGWAAGNWGWNNLAPRIIAWELDTCFFVKHFVKDMKIALEECEKMEITLPWLKLVASLYDKLIKHGEENLGTQALIKVIKRMNKMSLDS